MTTKDNHFTRKIRSFVRREGKMTPAQKQAVETLWPEYGLNLEDGVIAERLLPCFLEIGFGMGTSLFELAKKHPHKQFIGIEVYRPGVGALLRKVSQENLNNIKVYRDDAVEVLQHCIPDNRLEALLLFFPDPWHKKRHHKRRIVQADFIKMVFQKLKPGGYFHVATDWMPYAEHIAEIMQDFPQFKQATPDDFLKRPNTKYEARGIRLGHAVTDLVYLK